MIDCVLSWMMLFMGVLTENPNYFIASGVFAVASYLCRMSKGGAEK